MITRLEDKVLRVRGVVLLSSGEGCCDDKV